MRKAALEVKGEPAVLSQFSKTLSPNHLFLNTESILFLICPLEWEVFLTEDSLGLTLIRAHSNPSVCYGSGL